MNEQPGAFVLELRCLLPTPSERVFTALTSPTQLPRWWGPHGFRTLSVEVDLRRGGRYRFAMQPPDGAPFHLSGEYLEVDPPLRLSYTFSWEEPAPDDRETVVVLALRDTRAGTEVTLSQGEFATEERLALHRAGWSDSFDKLREFVSAAPE